jgi:hypothetical protein
MKSGPTNDGTEVANSVVTPRLLCWAFISTVLTGLPLDTVALSSDNDHPAFAYRMVIVRFRSQLVETKVQPIR